MRSSTPILTAVALLSGLLTDGVAATTKLKVPADFATIQDAVNSSWPGDSIIISAGVYHETVTVDGRQDLVIRAKPGAKVVVDAGGSGVPLSIGMGSEGIVIKGLRFRNTTADGVAVAFSTDVHLDRCRVNDVGGSGVVVTLSTGVHIEDARIADVDGDGVTLNGVLGGLVEGCRIRDVGMDGVRVIAEASTVRSNRIVDVAGAGVRLGDTPSSCRDCLVQENEIVRSQLDGIFAETLATDCSILDNVIDSSASTGIDLASTADGHVLAGNTVFASLDDGMIVASSDNLLIGNKVKSSDHTGFWFVLGGDNLVVSNVSKKANLYGFRVDGTGNALHGNSAAKSAGFDLYDTTMPGDNVFIDNSFPTVGP